MMESWPTPSRSSLLPAVNIASLIVQLYSVTPAFLINTSPFCCNLGSSSQLHIMASQGLVTWSPIIQLLAGLSSCSRILTPSPMSSSLLNLLCSPTSAIWMILPSSTASWREIWPAPSKPYKWTPSILTSLRILIFQPPTAIRLRWLCSEDLCGLQLPALQRSSCSSSKSLLIT